MAPLMSSTNVVSRRFDAASTPTESMASEWGVGTQKREFLWTDADFHRVQSLIYQRTGIRLSDGKQAMVYSRLSRRLRDTGHNSFADYLAWLNSQTGPEWQEFVNAMTTNLTSFFRESHHFEILEDHLKSTPTDDGWRIWCNAASTGEEPYSIAMTAMESLGPNAKFALTASDIDSRALALAANGIYRMDALKGVNEARMRRFFLRGKRVNEGMVRVRPELQRMIKFMGVNLIDRVWPLAGRFDVVFCRNVMIYFDHVTQRKVLERIHGVMKPRGLLFVGHAEAFGDSHDLFALKGKTVYVRS